MLNGISIRICFNFLVRFEDRNLFSLFTEYDSGFGRAFHTVGRNVYCIRHTAYCHPIILTWGRHLAVVVIFLRPLTRTLRTFSHEHQKDLYLCCVKALMGSRLMRSPRWRYAPGTHHSHNMFKPIRIVRLPHSLSWAGKSSQRSILFIDFSTKEKKNKRKSVFPSFFFLCPFMFWGGHLKMNFRSSLSGDSRGWRQIVFSFDRLSGRDECDIFE